MCGCPIYMPHSACMRRKCLASVHGFKKLGSSRYRDGNKFQVALNQEWEQPISSLPMPRGEGPKRPGTLTSNAKSRLSIMVHPAREPDYVTLPQCLPRVKTHQEWSADGNANEKQFKAYFHMFLIYSSKTYVLFSNSLFYSRLVFAVWIPHHYPFCCPDRITACDLATALSLGGQINS